MQSHIPAERKFLFIQSTRVNFNPGNTEIIAKQDI